MGTKTQIDFINQIEKNVRDLSKKFIKDTKTVGIGVLEGSDTLFPVLSSSKFEADKKVFISNNTTAKYVEIISIPDITHIKVEGDYVATFIAGTVLKQADSLEYINEAMFMYSKFRPRKVSADITGDGTQKGTLPDNWIPEFSKIVEVEYPIDEIPASRLKTDTYRIGYNEDGEPYILFADSFSDTQSYRVLYTLLHGWVTTETNTDVLVSTVPDSDFYCICNIASYKYLLGLASLSGASSNPQLNAEIVNYDNRVDAYRRLAKELLGQAASWLGIKIEDIETGKTKNKPASSSQQIRNTSYDGSGLMIKGRDGIIESQIN